MLAGVGDIDEKYEDYMAIIADDFITQKGITTVGVWALSGEYVVFKARTYDQQTDLDQLLKKIFGDKNGGAKDGATGAARLHLGLAGKTPDRESLLKMWKALLEQEFVR